MVPCARHIWSRIGIRHINYRNESTALKLSQMFILVDLLYVQRVESFCPIIAYQSIIIYFGKVWKRRVKKRRFEKVSSFKAETFKHAECLLLVLKKKQFPFILNVNNSFVGNSMCLTCLQGFSRQFFLWGGKYAFLL